jgi:hypothetical protein
MPISFCPFHGFVKLIDGQRMFGMVEKDGFNPCVAERFRKDIAHAASRHEGIHVLRGQDQMLRVLFDQAQVGIRTGKKYIDAVLLGSPVSRECQLQAFFPIEIGLGIDDQERCLNLSHAFPSAYRTVSKTWK